MTPEKEQRLRQKARRMVAELVKIRKQLAPPRSAVRVSDRSRGRPQLPSDKLETAKIYIEEGLPIATAAVKAGVGRTSIYRAGLSRTNVERQKALAVAK